MKKSREKQQPSRIREGCFVCGGVIVFFRYVRPAPLGALVQRELAAVRLTEGWIRAFLHCGRYLQPLRHGAERRATSPYTGEASPNGNIFSLRPQYRVALPSPRPQYRSVMPNSIRGGSSPLGPSCCAEAGGEAGPSPIREKDFKTSAIHPPQTENAPAGTDKPAGAFP